MAILQHSCCGCCTLRTGSIVVAVLWMITQLASLGRTAREAHINSMVFGYVGSRDITTLAINSGGIVCSILLIYGVKKEKPGLLRIWCSYASSSVIASFVVILIETIQLMSLVGAVGADAHAGVMTYVVLPILAGAWGIWAVWFILTVYGCLVVYSHYQNLRSGILAVQPTVQPVQTPYGPPQPGAFGPAPPAAYGPGQQGAYGPPQAAPYGPAGNA